MHPDLQNTNMTKIKLLLILVVLGCFKMQASTPPVKMNESKVTLSYIEIKDEAIRFVTSDIHAMILRKNRGFLWPATKIVFFKKEGKLYFDVTAIDNSWYNMFCDDEKPHGYFVVDGRVFIASSKGNEPVDLENYFGFNSEVADKTFHKADPKAKPVNKNPVWYYFHKGNMATVLDSVNMGSLGR